MVGVCIGEYSSRHGLDGDIVLDLDGDAEVLDAPLIPFHPLIGHRVQVAVPSVALGDLPQLHSLICTRYTTAHEEEQENKHC